MRGVSVTAALFSVGRRYGISHLYLKSLESKPSSSDVLTINSIWKEEAIKHNANLKPGQKPIIPKTFMPAWLYDAIIDAYVFILTLKYNDLFAIDCVAIVSMIDPQLPIKVRQNQQNMVPKTAKYFLMPCNLRGNHWTLLVVDIGQKSLMHLDSNNGSSLTKDEVVNIQKALMAFYAVECSGNIIKVQCAQQKDSENCGIFVIHFIELLAQGKSFLTPCDTDQLRGTIFKALVEDEGNKRFVNKSLTK